MKNKCKIKITIIVLGVIFTLSTISSFNIIGDQGNNDGTIEIQDETNLRSPKLSVTYIESFIHIDDNWTETLVKPWCTFVNGLYVIEYVTIDASGSPTGSGIFINNSKNEYFIIRNCTVYNAGSGTDDAGIRLEYTNNGNLINIDSTNNNRHGIYLHNNCDNNTISNCRVNDNTWAGIRIDLSCDENIIVGNILHNNNVGITLKDGCINNIISGNIANENRDRGILLWSRCNYNTISGNTAHKNSNEGIHLTHDCYNNTISRNNANDNGDTGISISDRSGENLVYKNCFIGNKLNARDSGIDNQWDNGTIGNYWDDYNGVDANDDGIGDTPYNVTSTEGSQDNFPLMKCPLLPEEGDDNGDGIIPGYNVFILLGVLSFVAILISKKIKKS